MRKVLLPLASLVVALQQVVVLAQEDALPLVDLTPSDVLITAPAAIAHKWTVVFLVVLASLLLFVYMQPAWLMDLVVRHSHHSVLWCASTSSRVCALTIDDAPSPATPMILDLLRHHNIKATFFIISNNIHGNEDVVKRIVDEGHRLANHLTEDRASILDELHVFEQKLKECDAVLDLYQPHKPHHHHHHHHNDDNATAAAASPLAVPEPNDADEAEDDVPTATTRLLSFSSSSGASPILTYGTSATKWLRPASGWFTSNMREIVASHGYRICMGSVYPHDAQIKSERINSLFLRLRTRPGSVIIVHDRVWTIGVLQDALPHLVEKFKFVSLDELTQHHQKSNSKPCA